MVVKTLTKSPKCVKLKPDVIFKVPSSHGVRCFFCLPYTMLQYIFLEGPETAFVMSSYNLGIFFGGGRGQILFGRLRLGALGGILFEWGRWEHEATEECKGLPIALTSSAPECTVLTPATAIFACARQSTQKNRKKHPKHEHMEDIRIKKN